jgi:hypothetical protein
MRQSLCLLRQSCCLPVEGMSAFAKIADIHTSAPALATQKPSPPS